MVRIVPVWGGESVAMIDRGDEQNLPDEWVPGCSGPQDVIWARWGSL